MHHPVGQLLPAATAQHHACGTSRELGPGLWATPGVFLSAETPPTPTAWPTLILECSCPQTPLLALHSLTSTIEATAQEEATELRDLPHQGLVVRGEGLCMGGEGMKNSSGRGEAAWPHTT